MSRGKQTTCRGQRCSWSSFGLSVVSVVGGCVGASDLVAAFAHVLRSVNTCCVFVVFSRSPSCVLGSSVMFHV